MRRQLIELLTAYLSKEKSLHDCAEWLASINWDDPALDGESRNLVERLELLATEVVEGLRLEAEFLEEASKLLQEGS